MQSAYAYGVICVAYCVFESDRLAQGRTVDLSVN